MLNRVYVWDIFVRLFHWSLVVAFAANAIFIDEESNLHLYVGYFVAALLAARLVWGSGRFSPRPFLRFLAITNAGFWSATGYDHGSASGSRWALALGCIDDLQFTCHNSRYCIERIYDDNRSLFWCRMG